MKTATKKNTFPLLICFCSLHFNFLIVPRNFFSRDAYKQFLLIIHNQKPALSLHDFPNCSQRIAIGDGDNELQAGRMCAHAK